MSASYRKRFSLTEYTSSKLKLATDDLSKRLRLPSEGIWDDVYKAHIDGVTVAIKFLSLNGKPEYYFKYMVRVSI